MKLTHESLVIDTFPTGSFACNCSIIYDKETKEALIIDPGNDKAAIQKKVADLDIKVGLLLHTHAHFDHIGESKTIKDLYDCPMALHKGDHELYLALKQQGMFFGHDLSDPGEVDIWLEDEQEFTLKAKSENLKGLIKTIYSPGHTEGSCCFYSDVFSQPVLFSGDTLFQSSIGRTDLPGGDSQLILKSIKSRLYTLPDETIVVPGHGPNTQIFAEKRQNPFIRS